MKYGYFDNQEKEYVITRPDTPKPWANYLGSTQFGAIISNNAGGYSFEKSGADGRLIRYIFDGNDRPGRYLYLRDDDKKDYWSLSWQPVGKDLSVYQNECRHGLGYTIISSDYLGIHTKTEYYVPLNKSYEVWSVLITNHSTQERRLTLTGYCEFTNNANYEQDLVNLQYSRYIESTAFRGNRVRQVIHGNLIDRAKMGKPYTEDYFERFFGLVGADVDSFCGDRNAFIGNYRSYGNPIGVEEGKLANADGYNGYGCGALSSKIVLKPGETRRITFLLAGKGDEEAEKILKEYEDEKRPEADLKELKAVYQERLSHFQVHTPDERFDTMINVWNAYNCFMTFLWSRAASFVYCGLRNGYGYRDTVQDIQGIIHLKPEMAKEKLSFMLSAQVHHGGGLPLVKFTHNAGHEDTPEDASYRQSTGHPSYRADDALWLFPTVYKYVAESGDTDYLNQVIPFADKEEGSVYEHLKRAIQFSENHLGPHGLPAGLYADWNDCLRLGANGESTFVAFQFYYAYSIQRQFASFMKDEAYEKELAEKQRKLFSLIQRLTYDQDRFIRGFKEDGTIIGGRDDKEANMWLNPQSWAIISGAATDDEKESISNLVEERLNTEYGLVLVDPPYHMEAFDGVLCKIYNLGVKENGGIFSQTQGWAILSEALLGHGDRAYRYWYENAPSVQNDHEEIRKMEPYCYGQFTEGYTSPHFGESHVHWLTGTASTMMVGCVEGILGMRPDLKGLRIAPSIPSSWDELTIEKDYRGHHLSIHIHNPNHKESGFTSLFLNGEERKDNYLPEEILKEENQIEFTL